jgi:hypothetical protein
MSEPPPSDMKRMLQEMMSKASSNTMVMILLFFLLFFVLMYIYLMVQKQEYNCKLIKSYPFQTMKKLSNNILDLPLNKTFVKTAYNCCCTGDFKNDYVDTCALLNCAKQGVRALDFTLYSLNGEPVIAASTLPSKRYKEMYNHLPFFKTMTQVKQMFLYDTVNCTNTNDPLFLILRIQSSNTEVYNKIGDALSGVFGEGNATNRLYLPNSTTTLDNETISNLNGKVIVMLDITGLSGISNSKLVTLAALQLGTMSNQIYRESEAYNLLESGISPNVSSINVLYPDFQSKSTNYDFNTVGLKQKFQFIGLNFQMNDIYLDAYNKYFTSSIIKQPTNP